MFEKVNPAHPDKIADRIAGALVDLAYTKAENPKIAVEVLIGHGDCHIIAETSEHFGYYEVALIVTRILGTGISIDYKEVPQDTHLAQNQDGAIRCGDNGIFKGTLVTDEQKRLSDFARSCFRAFPFDGKYILNGNDITVCQSNAKERTLRAFLMDYDFGNAVVNPLGEWTGGTDVDTGATNRKLGSDMGDGVTGGGLHGKDLSKADVSVNIYAFLKAQELGEEVKLCCSIGDETVCGVPYSEIVETARRYIKRIGGFEKFAMWGLI